LNFTIERYVISDLACDKRLLAETIISSLMISYGIRVDTQLWLKENKLIYVLNGLELRHLHPQERSVEGFIEKIILQRKLVPGVAIYPKTMLEKLLKDEGVCIVRNRDIEDTGACRDPLTTIHLGNLLHPILRVFIVASPDVNPIDMYCVKTLVIEDRYDPLFIAKSHYLIDVTRGAWVRRRGEIEYYKPTAGRGFE